MNNKVTFISENYYTGNNTTVCVLNCIFKYNIKTIPEVLVDKILATFPGINCNELTNPGYFSFEVSGKSKCHKDDTFDPIKGKRIAESRAKYKAYNTMWRITRIIYKYFEDNGFQFRRSSVNYTELTYKEFLHINNLENK